MKAVVIGDGINELVASSYLALAHHEVTLVRQRLPASDDAVEPLTVPPKIVRDLDLSRHGLKIHRPEAWAMVWPEETEIALTADISHAADAIRKLSAHDAGKWPAFCARLHAFSQLLESVYSAPPPDPMAPGRHAVVSLARNALRVRALGRSGMRDFFRLLPMSAADFLDEWFESDVLKGVLGAAAVTNAAHGPRSGGTAFNLLHQHVGNPPGVFRPGLANLRATLERRTAATVENGAVSRIASRAGRVQSVALGDGRELPADIVVSGLSPRHTLLELSDAGLLDPELVRALRNIRSRGVAAEILLTLDRDPRFTTLVVAPSLDYLERAYDAIKYGHVSPEPYMEATNLGTTGNSRFHVRIHVQYVPRKQRDAAWDTHESDMLGRSIVARLSEHVPGLARWVINQTVLTPADFEHIHGFPEGQPNHAEIALDQVLWMRPVPALAGYRTPIDGLYLCGPAMHPGGDYAGIAGANAAAVIMQDLKAGHPRPASGRGRG
jgi:phytoene dehydrogenase-like protein